MPSEWELTEHEFIMRNQGTGKFHYVDCTFDFGPGYDTLDEARRALREYTDRL